MTGFERIGDEELLAGPIISVSRRRFRAPDGEEFDRQVVHHPGAVAIVPVAGDGLTVHLVRQFRAPLGTELLEVPAGKLDVEGEDPVAAAHRELTEEIGWRARQLEQLAVIHNSAGFCDERTIIYLATGLEPAEIERHGVEERYMTIEDVQLDAVPDLIAGGALTDAKTIVGLLLVARRLATNGLGRSAG